MNIFLAVLAGFALWSVLWLGGNPLLAKLFSVPIAEGQPITKKGLLVALLVFSVLISLASGYLTASIANADGTTPQLALGVLLLVTGVYFQRQSWELMPLWYHLIFLALLLPGALYGATLAG